MANIPPKGGIPAFMEKRSKAVKNDPKMEARKGVAAKRLAELKAKKGK
jgi:hypothetical protein